MWVCVCEVCVCVCGLLASVLCCAINIPNDVSCLSVCVCARTWIQQLRGLLKFRDKRVDLVKLRYFEFGVGNKK